MTKGSEFTATTTNNIVTGFDRSGMPAGVINNIYGDAASIGEELLNNHAVKKISFTGSTRVGKILMDGASRTNTKLTLEMGGNAPVIISSDVDVDAMAKVVRYSQKFGTRARFAFHHNVFLCMIKYSTASPMSQKRIFKT